MDLTSIPRVTVVTALLAAAIFILDLFIAIGVAIPILYVLPLIIASNSARQGYVVGLAASCSVLTVLGAMFSPPGATLGEVVVNRALSLLVIWGGSLILIQRGWAQAGQRVTEEQLRGILQSAMDAVITVDEEQKVVVFNQAAVQMFRCSAAEAIGQPIDRFIPERFRHAHREHIQSFGKTNVTSRRMGALGTVSGLRANGEEFPVEASISQIQTSRGRFYSVILRDITERKRAEEALRESGARHRAIVENALDAVITMNEQGLLVGWNSPAERMFGWSGDEVIGRPLADMIIPLHLREAHKQGLKNYLATGEGPVLNKRIEITALHRDGHEFPVELSIVPIHQEGRTLFSAFMRDISERKRAEEQFRLAVEASPHGMLMVDETGTILLVNAQIEAQFGYSREELLGGSVEILLPQALRARHREHRAGFFAHPEPRRMGGGRELFGLRKDGREIPVEIGLNPIQTTNGLRVLASVVDITARKQMEAQLRQTERLAELGTLASGMAHEIGTPMNVILGRAEYLMQRTNDEATRKGLSTIATQVERITKVMNQLLAIARRRPAERQAMDLRHTIEDSLEIVQERLARHRIQVEVVLADPVPTIQADADQMSQVLLNLIMNAIHAMPDGGTLRVGLARGDSQARITVADTGHGILPEDLPKIFDAFFTTKETGKGTGLGLTVVKGIIEEHGGTITVESKPGHGTTFTITLPLEASR